MSSEVELLVCDWSLECQGRPGPPPALRPHLCGRSVGEASAPELLYSRLYGFKVLTCFLPLYHCCFLRLKKNHNTTTTSKSTTIVTATAGPIMLHRLFLHVVTDSSELLGVEVEEVDVKVCEEECEEDSYEEGRGEEEVKRESREEKVKVDSRGEETKMESIEGEAKVESREEEVEVESKALSDDVSTTFSDEHAQKNSHL